MLSWHRRREVTSKNILKVPGRSLQVDVGVAERTCSGTRGRAEGDLGASCSLNGECTNGRCGEQGMWQCFCFFFPELARRRRSSVVNIIKLKCEINRVTLNFGRFVLNQNYLQLSNAERICIFVITVKLKMSFLSFLTKGRAASSKKEKKTKQQQKNAPRSRLFPYCILRLLVSLFFVSLSIFSLQSESSNMSYNLSARNWQFKMLHLSRGFRTRILLLIVSPRKYNTSAVRKKKKKRNGFWCGRWAQ